MKHSINDKKFDSKIVILTGAGSGIGKALAEILAKNGAIVYALDRNEEGLKTHENTENIRQVPLDVTDSKAYQNCINKILENHNRIDYLFNNAGVTLLSDAINLSFEQWESLLDVNIMGVCNGIAAVYPIMVKQQFGHIINTASIAAVTGYATAAPYTCSKAFVVGLTKSLRPEAKKHNVSVTLVCPGYVKTNIFSSDRIIGTTRERVMKHMPFKFITPEKAARYIFSGTLKKKKKIIFPFSSKFIWFVATWMPCILQPFQSGFLKPFRQN